MQTKLDLTDKIGSVGSAPEEHFLFVIEDGPFRLYDFPDTVQIAITYELNRDLKIVRRKVYGLLDFLGDIGGLAGALKGLFASLIVIFQYKEAINYVSKLQGEANPTQK